MSNNHRFASTKISSSNSNQNDQRKDHVTGFIDSCITQEIISTLRSKQHLIKWSCFDCKAEISVNIRNIVRGLQFDYKSLFCKNHKPTNSDIKRNFIFIRYEDSFYKHIKTKTLQSCLNINE